ncbi:MAG: recombinase family protein [Nitrospiraceae bacterium]
MKIGYLRVSTQGQKEDRQEDGLKDLCDELYMEKLSAVSKTRPVYQKVIEKLQPRDTLVVWDIDRAFRSTIDALQEVEKLRRREIEFHIVNLNVDTSTPSGEFIYTVMAAFSQLERQTLIQRTKEGMAAAKLRGKHIGRPRNPILEEVVLAHSRIEAGEGTVAELAAQYGCSRKNLEQQLNRLVINGTFN